MPGYRLLLLGLFYFSSPALSAQAIRYDALVSTSIGYLHDTLLVGQPAFIYFIIRNSSNDTIFVEEGSDLALEALIFAASGEENTQCQVFGDSIHLVLTTADPRQNALRGIMQHHSSTALDFLLAKKDDPYPYEREYILSRAPTLMPAAAARSICYSFLTDKHPVIRRKAQASLEYLETVGRKNK